MLNNHNHFPVLATGPTAVFRLNGAEGASAVALPALPFQVVFEDDAVEVIEDELAVFVVVAASVEQLCSIDSRAPAESMPLHFHADVGSGDGVAVGVSDRDTEVAFP